MSLSVNQVAAKSGYCVDTVRKAIRNDFLKAKKKGRAYIIHETDYNKWERGGCLAHDKEREEELKAARDSRLNSQLSVQSQDDANQSDITKPNLFAPPGKVLDFKQAAKYLGLALGNIEQYVETGQLTRYKNGIHVSDLDRFIIDNGGTVCVPIMVRSVVIEGWHYGGSITNGETYYDHWEPGCEDKILEERILYNERVVTWPQGVF